jgi:hypothetical protein
MELGNEMNLLEVENSLTDEQVSDYVDSLTPLTDEELEYLDIIGGLELLDFDDDLALDDDDCFGEWNTKEIK